MNNELNLLNDNTIEKIFEGKLQKQFKCQDCNLETLSKIEDGFFILNLPTESNKCKKKDLEDCLKDFTKSNKIEWPCLNKNCGNGDEISTGFKVYFSKLPKVIIIRLKTSVENNISVNYQNEVCLNQYLMKQIDSLADSSESSDNESSSSTYSLIGVVTHSGTQSSGHCND